MSRSRLNAVLLLDEITRSRMKVGIAELVNYGVIVISSMRELDESIIEQTKTVLILEGYLRRQYSYRTLRLYKETFDLDLVYVGTDKVLSRSVEGLARCYNIDPTMLDYDRTYSIIYEDRSLLTKFTVADTSITHLTYAHSVASDESYGEDVRNLASSHIALHELLDNANNDKLVLGMRITELQQQLEASRLQETRVTEAYLELIANAKQHNRSLQQYEPILANDIYRKVSLARYSNPPHIIYLKQYEELIHLNSFVRTLYDVFRTQLKQSVKVLRLHDSSASRKMLTIPDYYHQIGTTFKSSEAVTNDFLIRVGNYEKLMDTILNNFSNLHLLIVVDCKDHDDRVLAGQYLQVAMCRNVKNIEKFNLDPESTVVNFDAGNVMSWDHYPEYELSDLDARFAFMSSVPVIQRLFELHRRFSQIGG